VTKKFFANMRHYQGPAMPLLAHMLNQGEPALVQAQPQEVSPPPPSPVVEPHPLTDPMPSPPRQSSPLPILFGPAPSSDVASTDPILDIPSSSRPSEPVLEAITSLIQDDDTGGGSFPERPPSPSLATPTRTTLEAELKATKILHRDAVGLFAKRIKKLESKLKTKKRKLVLSDSENEEDARQSQELEALLDLANVALHEPSHSSTPSKPVYPDQSFEQKISPTSLDAVLTLSQSKTGARAAKIIYKRLKKQQSSSGLDFTDVAIPVVDGGDDPADVVVSAGGVDPADVVVSAGGADSAGTFISAGISVAAGPSVPSAPSSPIRDPAKGKAIAALSSPRVAEEQERESRASTAQSTQRPAELDRIALNLTNEEWIGLVDQVQANPILSAELLGADVSEDTFSVRMVDLMNQRQKAIADMKAKAKRDKPLTLAQQKEYMRAFVKNQSTAIYTTGWSWKDVRGLTDDQLQNRSGETLESSESKKLKSSHSTEQSAELQDTTSVSAGATIATGDPISAVSSVSAASSIPAETPIPAGVSTTTSVFESYLRQVSDDDEPAEPVSLSLVSDIRTWEIIPTKFGLGEIHVITRADGTVKRFSTLRELMHWDQWEIQSWRFYALPAIHVLETEFGDIMYMFVDKKYPILPVTIQRMLNHGLEIDRDPSDLLKVCRALTMSAMVLNCLTFKLEEIVMAMMTCLKSSGVHYQCFTKLDNKQVTIQFRGGLLGIIIPTARVFCSCCQFFISAGVLFLLLEYSVPAVMSSLQLLVLYCCC
nr:hypothetical protein [Tanacetum cinerariifolium]